MASRFDDPADSAAGGVGGLFDGCRGIGGGLVGVVGRLLARFTDLADLRFGLVGALFGRLPHALKNVGQAQSLRFGL
ncbi:MAG: hypothetical protein BRD57_06530 [Proteobacteria bacterium SW_6_67_9]|nr:MAG: hypothetical protein BRD57_06530 [Proteobacteria bacterium SW_6_67_9]